MSEATGDKRRGDREFSVRGLTAGVAVVIVVVWATALLSLRQSEQRHRERAAVATENMVQLLDGQIMQAISRIDQGLQLLLRDSDSPAALRSTASYLAQQDRLRFVGVFDAGDHLLAGAAGTLPADPERWLREIEAQNAPLATLPVFAARGDAPPVLLLSRMAAPEKGGAPRRAVAALPLSALDEMLGGLELGKRGSVALRDRAFRLLARRSAEANRLPLGDTRVSGEFSSRVASGLAAASFVVVTPFDGIERTTAFSQIDDLPLYAIVSLAANDYLQPWHEEVRQQLAFTALVTLAIGLAAWLAWRGLRMQSRHIAAIALREEEFRAIANYTRDWESWLNPDGSVRWVSPAVECVIGYSAAECMAMADYPEALVVTEDRPQWEILRAALRKALQAAPPTPDASDAADGGEPQSAIGGGRALRDVGMQRFQCRVRHRDGSTVWIDSSCHPVRAADGAFLGYRIGSSDISLQKRHDDIERMHYRIFEALSGSDELAAILALIEDSVETACPGSACCVLLHAPEEQCLVPATPRRRENADAAPALDACAHPCCICASKGTRYTVRDIGADEHCQSACLCGIDNSALHGCHCEPLRGRDGRLLGVLAVRSDPAQHEFEACAPLVEGAARLACIAIERRQNEEALRRSIAELRQANITLVETRQQLMLAEKHAAVGMLAAGAAHEINNPIGFAISNLGTLADYLESLIALVDCYEKGGPALSAALPATLSAEIEKARDYADLPFIREDAGSLISQTLRGLERIGEIVGALRTFAGVDSDRDGHEFQPADLEATLDVLLAVAGRSLGADIEIRRDYKGVPPVPCRIAQIKQVLLTVFGNALDAIRDNPPQRPGRIVVRTGADAGAAQAWIEVADNGKGIAPDHLDRIFEPFFTTKPAGHGTGLGLAHAYGVLREHGGRLSARNGEEGGAVIRIVLPLERDAPPAAAGATAQPDERQDEKPQAGQAVK